MNGRPRQRIGNTQGFTIVELIIVIVVIAILATIVVVGFGASQNGAHDTSVRSDLQKIDDAFKVYALDNDGVFPYTVAALNALNIKLTTGSYNVTNISNVYLCYSPSYTEYAAIAMSLSGQRFVVKSESGISTYTGSVVWSPSQDNRAPTCTSIDSTYVEPPGGITGFRSGVWGVWTGAASITNLATNPSAESNATKWNSWIPNATATQTRVTGGAYSGNSFIRVTWSTGGPSAGGGIYYGSGLSDEAPSQPGTQYSFSVFVRVNTPMTLRLGTEWYNSSGGYVNYSEASPVSIPANTWTRLSYDGITALPNATRMAVSMYPAVGYSWSAGNVLDADALLITVSPTSYSFADGNSLNWLWNGTANQSTSSGPAISL